MADSKIEWTDKTWNPVTGCTKVSQGCKNCYAETLAKRFWGKRQFTDIELHEERLFQPVSWKKPCMVFVNSMSDLFHERLPREFISKVFAVMICCERHTFQVLTKRAKAMAEYFNQPDWPGQIVEAAKELWPEDIQHLKIEAYLEHDLLKGFLPPNIWLGTSVEHQQTANERIPHLIRVPAMTRFLSCEPLLESIEIIQWHREQIHWVIAGGESGPKARPMHPDWPSDLRDQCQEAGIPFFFKQWGELLPHCQAPELSQRNPVQFPSPNTPGKKNTYYKVGKAAAGNLLDGKTYMEYPKTQQYATV